MAAPNEQLHTDQFPLRKTEKLETLTCWSTKKIPTSKWVGNTVQYMCVHVYVYIGTNPVESGSNICYLLWCFMASALGR